MSGWGRQITKAASETQRLREEEKRKKKRKKKPK
jgi:hypothetical protein